MYNNNYGNLLHCPLLRCVSQDTAFLCVKIVLPWAILFRFAINSCALSVDDSLSGSSSLDVGYVLENQLGGVAPAYFESIISFCALLLLCLNSLY